MEAGRIWEWMILIINDDRQMMIIINIQKRKQKQDRERLLDSQKQNREDCYTMILELTHKNTEYSEPHIAWTLVIKRHIL